MIASLFRQHWEVHLTYLSLFCSHSTIRGSERFVLSILKILCEQSEHVKRIRTNKVFSSTIQNNLCSLATKAGVSTVIHKNQILYVEKKKNLFLRSLYCLLCKDSISDPTQCSWNMEKSFHYILNTLGELSQETVPQICLTGIVWPSSNLDSHVYWKPAACSVVYKYNYRQVFEQYLIYTCFFYELMVMLMWYSVLIYINSTVKKYLHIHYWLIRTVPF